MKFQKFGAPGDVIAAVATPPGTGAIGIIRISGAGARACVERIIKFSGMQEGSGPEPRKMTLAAVVDPEDEKTVDRVLFCHYPAPYSYTGEDMVEIFCHGGPMVTREILHLALCHGARGALPGEFTQRAYLNGKMDLTRAESVLDIIQARNRRFLDDAVRRLEGSLCSQVRRYREKLVELLAAIEVVIEYPEEDSPQVSPQVISETARSVLDGLQRLIDAADSSRISNEGVRVAVIGKPNAGKSSIVNRILGYDRVIVSDVPGTTRDLVSEWFAAGGIDFCVMDTAGITDTGDPVEREGVRRSLEHAGLAGLVIAVFDSSREWTGEDERVLAVAEEAGGAILVVNKIDLQPVMDRAHIADKQGGPAPLEMSALTGEGLEDLLKAMRDHGEDFSGSDAGGIFLNLRQKSLLSEAVGHLGECVANAGRVADDIVTIDLREAVDCLGEITGESTTEDILSSIFSNFCVGK